MLSELYRIHGEKFLKSPEFKYVWDSNLNFKMEQNRVISKHNRNVVIERMDKLFNINKVPSVIHQTIMKAFYQVLFDYGVTETFIENELEDVTTDNHRFVYEDFKTYQHPIMVEIFSTNFVNVGKAVMIDEFKSYMLYTVIGAYGTKVKNYEYIKFHYYFHDNVLNFTFYGREPMNIGQILCSVNLINDNWQSNVYEVAYDQISKRIYNLFFKNNLKYFFGNDNVNFVKFSPSHLLLVNYMKGINVNRFSEVALKEFTELSKLDFKKDLKEHLKTIEQYISLFKMMEF